MVAGGLGIALVTIASRGVVILATVTTDGDCWNQHRGAAPRLAFYELEWSRDQGDTRVDALHLVVSHALIEPPIAVSFGSRTLMPEHCALWPTDAPIWAQLLRPGAIMDFGLHAMHRASHASGFFWRLYALHHGPMHLY